MGRQGLVWGALAAVLVGAAGGAGWGLLVLGAVVAVWAGGVHRRLDEAERALAELRAATTSKTASTSAPAAVPRPAPIDVATAPVPAPVPTPKPIPAPMPVSMPASMPMPARTTAPAAPVAPAAASAPRASASPREVDERSAHVTSSLGASIKAWFTGGNTIVRVAVVILFLGVAFLLRYAAENAVLPIELRLAGVALGGLALAGVGWRLRDQRRGYGLSLQGAGIGVLYLTLFAALRLYQLVPPALAFALLVVLAAVSALLAVLQDALPLAVLGFAGGFLAPVLTSTGQGSHVMLFSYDLVLNAAIAWIASRKAWKLLNLVGFGFTFAIGTAWGVMRWEPALLASTEPFLIAHVALYLWICVGYSRQLAALATPRLPYVDGGLLFGLPIAAFGLQAAMLRHVPYGLAASAAVMSAVYLLLGRWLWRTLGERLRLLTEGMLALGVVFLALIAPLALDARWTAAAWALQGAGMVWVALRQRRSWALGMGALLQLLAALRFWAEAPAVGDGPAFFNAAFLGTLMLALAALASARLLAHAADAAPAQVPEGTPLADQAWVRSVLHLLHGLLLALGVLHLVGGADPQLRALGWAVPDLAQRHIAWFALLALAGEGLHARLRWPVLAWPARGLLGAALAMSLFEALGAWWGPGGGWARWWPEGLAEALGLLLLGAWVLRRLDQGVAGRPARGSLAAEALALGWYALLQGALLGYAVGAQFIQRHEAWTPALVLLVPCMLGFAVMRRLPGAGAGAWPVAPHPQAWWRGFVLPWLGLGALWVAGVNLLADGGMAPLPYVPLLNPVDLGHALLALLALRAWQCAAHEATKRGLLMAASTAAFVWLNGLLLRSLHQWAGAPMWLDGAFDSGLVQMSLSVLWATLALAAMGVAARRSGVASARALWLAGAALLAVVVAKLLLVDLSHTSALQRIGSFMGVGLLMLVIGYLAPLPPARRDLPAVEGAAP
ncbi:MAG: DUF2339 domain-containing protein [Burkholderiaceae bacterium]